MNKTFEIKKYSLTGSFLETIKRTNIISDFYFSSSINAWQWECNIEFNLSVWDTTFSLWQFLKIYVFTDIYPDWKLMYTWMITRINWNITNWKETLNISLLWLWSLLTFIYYKNWWNYNFSLTQEPATTLKDIIDYFNTIYTWSWLNYWSNVVNYWTSITQVFNYNKCNESLTNTTNTTTYWWNIRSNWELFFKAKPTLATHLLTLWKDIDNLTIQQDSERIINKHILFYTWWDTSQIDATSQTSFWVREIKEDTTRINDLATANIYASNYVSKNKDYKKKTSIIVNNSFDIEKIEVWDTISVLNTTLSLINLQIYKIQYSINTIQIELEEFDSLAKEIIS